MISEDYEFGFLSDTDLLLMLKSLIMPDDEQFAKAIRAEINRREHEKIIKKVENHAKNYLTPIRQKRILKKGIDK